MSSISAGLSDATALVSTGDTTGELVLKTNGGTTAVTIGTDQSVTFAAGVVTTSPTVLPAGTASAPALTTTGDTNTGLFFPAADTIAFSEGGAECARFDSSANFQFNSGYGSVATAYGCRAWVNFNGTGTVAIREDGNVSSITDEGTGDYTVNFTTAMPDVNYSAIGTTNNGDADGVPGNDYGLFSAPKRTFAPATGSIRVGTRNVDSNNQDMKYVYVAIFR